MLTLIIAMIVLYISCGLLFAKAYYRFKGSDDDDATAVAIGYPVLVPVIIVVGLLKIVVHCIKYLVIQCK